MKFTSRSRTVVDQPGVHGAARLHRRARSSQGRLAAGEIVVIDQLDLDRATAQTFVDAGVVAVLNASAMISGRFPAVGPQILADAGVVMVDELGADLFAAVREGDTLRVDAETVHLPKGRQLQGRALDAAQVTLMLEDARTGLAHQLDAFTHNSSEFLRRESELLIHGAGIPALATNAAGRPAVVVMPGSAFEGQLKKIKRFLAEQRPVVIAVEGAAEQLMARKIVPDVIVLSSGSEDVHIPAAALRKVTDVVIRVERGAARAVAERFSTMGVVPLLFESTATTEDAALLIADSSQASVIIGVGTHATLSDFLDRQRAGLASTYLTRLKVGERLVDSSVLDTVYSGRVRPRHLVGVIAAGLIALAAAISTTPVGQDWVDLVGDQTSSFIDTVEGKFS